MEKILKFFDSIGLEIAPEKSQLIIFSPSKTQTSSFHITINNIKINAVNEVKYLGTWIDSRLNWNAHAKDLINKVQKALNILKLLRGTWWGGHPQVLLNVYKGLMRSIIEYNSCCIHIKEKSLREKLNKLQYKAIRLALGYRNSTPINVLLAEAKEPTLNIRFHYLANK